MTSLRDFHFVDLPPRFDATTIVDKQHRDLNKLQQWIEDDLVILFEEKYKEVFVVTSSFEGEPLMFLSFTHHIILSQLEFSLRELREENKDYELLTGSVYIPVLRLEQKLKALLYLRESEMKPLVDQFQLLCTENRKQLEAVSVIALFSSLWQPHFSPWMHFQFFHIHPFPLLSLAFVLVVAGLSDWSVEQFVWSTGEAYVSKIRHVDSTE